MCYMYNSNHQVLKSMKSMKFQLLVKGKKKLFALKLSDVFILFINVKMYYWYFNIYEQDQFHAQLS